MYRWPPPHSKHTNPHFPYTSLFRLSAGDRDLYARQHFVESWDSSVRVQHRLAPTVETPALFVSESDAEAEAARLGALWGVPRDVINVRIAGQVFLRWVGDVASLDLEDAAGNARSGLPRDAVVIALFENARNGETRLVMVARSEEHT